MTTDVVDHRRSLGAIVEARLTAHETLDEERFEGFRARLTRIETIITGAAGAVIVGQATVIATLLWRLPAPHP
jgi:hypothetical protein